MFIAHFNDVVFISKLIDFVIFVTAILWLFNKYGKPALVAHQEAQNRIAADAVKHREESEAAIAGAEAAIDRAKRDASRMVEVGEAQAARFIDVQVEEAKAHAQRIFTHASGELQRERYRVRKELLEETVQRAHARAKDLAREEIDSAKQRTLVESLIDHLERASA